MTIPDTTALIEQLTSLKSPSKEFGQHYLHDDAVLSRAVELGDVGAEDVVLEIGSGPGTLTAHLLNNGAKVHAIEIDPESCTHLRHIFSQEIDNGQLELFEGDALQIDWSSEITSIVANIPYQISSPLIERILNHHRSGRRLQTVVLLLQDEFASRLAMLDGPSNHGPLGITTAFEWEVETDLIVQPDSFRPAPAIRSRLVRLRPLEDPYQLPSGVTTPNLKFARMIVRECFTERRKKMRNRITQIPKRIARVKGWYAKSYRAAAKAVLRQQGIIGLPTGWPDARPEQLSVVEWLVLTSHIESQKVD